MSTEEEIGTEIKQYKEQVLVDFLLSWRSLFY